MKSSHGLFLEVEEENGGENKNPATFLSALGSISN
jgi:hypothetical protein